MPSPGGGVGFARDLEWELPGRVGSLRLPAFAPRCAAIHPPRTGQKTPRSQTEDGCWVRLVPDPRGPWPWPRADSREAVDLAWEVERSDRRSNRSVSLVRDGFR